VLERPPGAAVFGLLDVEAPDLQEAPMSEKPVKQPGPDHPITIEPNPSRVVVSLGGQTIADTRAALTLQEANYPAVQYIPFDDVDATQLVRSEHTSYCPFKGDASYFSLPAGGERSKDSVWQYQEPHDAVSEIAGYVAFYPDRVDAIEETS
jgi:uncharacterized protein (DUF427 family)